MIVWVEEGFAVIASRKRQEKGDVDCSNYNDHGFNVHIPDLVTSHGQFA
jgi:hypothetical protein